MRKAVYLFVLVFALALPGRVSAQFAVLDAALVGVMTGSWIESATYYAQQIAQTIQSVFLLKEQIEHMVKAEVRAIKNLRGIADVRSYDQFMAWHNRQLYMDREVEDRFMNLGIKIGGTTYRMDRIEDIPDAFKNTFANEEYWEEGITEEQRREMYTNLGLSASNYAYIKTWQEREKRLARRLLGDAEIIAEENDRAAEINSDMAEEYLNADGEIDANEILKKSHITQMNIEMAIRESNLLMAKRNEYDAARNKELEMPPNPPRLSYTWNEDPFEKITTGSGKTENYDD